jgi:peptidoglycan/LPS O-acetylase OafA/YrhL
VLHMATFPLGIAIASAVIPPAWSHNAPAAVGGLVVATWIIAIAPFGIIGYHLIEVPGIALGRMVIASQRKRATARPG